VLATALPLVREDEWWIRIFDFPRLQLFIAGAIVLVATLVVWDLGRWQAWAIVALLAAALVLQGTRIAPYTRFAPVEVAAVSPTERHSTVSLVVANVLMDNRKSDALLAVVRETAPDLILLLEPDSWWEERMRVLETDYPHSLKRAQDNEYGMLLYSRLPLHDGQVQYLIREDVPSMHVRLAVGPGVRLHAVHPEPPVPTQSESSAPRDAELLLVGEETRRHGGPTIVAGDLNDVAWSHTTTLFQKISGLLDPRKGRGMFNTFHAKIPVLRWPLDHVFHSEHFLLGDIRRLPAIGSDHYPIYVRLALRPEAPAIQEKPAADAKDHEEAAERIREMDR
jgi:endonuclease/exonuclease/phosphatase (EEP) superfamily protein YafD